MWRLALVIVLLALAPSIAAAKPRPARHLLVPAPPEVHYVEGLMPNDPEGANFAATADPMTRTIYYQGRLPAAIKGHETGHLLDYEVLSDGDRHFFTRLIGLKGPWDQGTGWKGQRSPIEFFADWYGNAAVGNDPSRAWSDAYAPAPNPQAFKRFRQALDRLGKRHNLQPYQP